MHLVFSWILIHYIEHDTLNILNKNTMNKNVLLITQNTVTPTNKYTRNFLDKELDFR